MGVDGIWIENSISLIEAKKLSILHTLRSEIYCRFVLEYPKELEDQVRQSMSEVGEAPPDAPWQWASSSSSFSSSSSSSA